MLGAVHHGAHDALNSTYTQKIAPSIAPGIAPGATDPSSPARASWAFIGLYALAYTGIWLALLTPVIVTISLRVRELTPELAAQNLALILSSGAACAMLAGPLFGYLSDRTTSRFGMRRPWMIGGILGGAIALVFVATAQSIGAMLIAWCIAQIAFNAALASTVALLADQIPSHQRGTVAGILNVCMPIGQLIGTFIVQLVAGSLLLAFLIPTALGTFAVLLLAYVLPDRRLQASAIRESPCVSETPITRSRGYRDFWFAWLSRLLLGVGTAFLTTYQALYLIESLGRDPREIPVLIFRSMLLQSVLIVIVSLLAGRLSDRFARRKVFVLLGAVVYAIGLWLIAAADSYATFLIGLAVAAVAHGTYFAVDLALVTEVLPDSERHAAKDLGILNITNALPQVIAPLVGAMILLLAQGDYSTMYAIAGAIALTSAAALVPIRAAR
jgi:MFS family permease